MPLLETRHYKVMALSGDHLWQRGISRVLAPSSPSAGDKCKCFHAQIYLVAGGFHCLCGSHLGHLGCVIEESLSFPCLKAEQKCLFPAGQKVCLSKCACPLCFQGCAQQHPPVKEKSLAWSTLHLFM